MASPEAVLLRLSSLLHFLWPLEHLNRVSELPPICVASTTLPSLRSMDKKSKLHILTPFYRPHGAALPHHLPTVPSSLARAQRLQKSSNLIFRLPATGPPLFRVVLRLRNNYGSSKTRNYIFRRRFIGLMALRLSTHLSAHVERSNLIFTLPATGSPLILRPRKVLSRAQTSKLYISMPFYRYHGAVSPHITSHNIRVLRGRLDSSANVLYGAGRPFCSHSSSSYREIHI